MIRFPPWPQDDTSRRRPQSQRDYHRDLDSGDHHDWQLTGIDFRTGWPVFSIKGFFPGKDFDDNTMRIVRRMTLGKGFYGKKVFNNIWGTFSFGPDNSIFIGTFRGYVRFSSDPWTTSSGFPHSSATGSRF